MEFRRSRIILFLETLTEVCSGPLNLCLFVILFSTANLLAEQTFAAATVIPLRPPPPALGYEIYLDPNLSHAKGLNAYYTRVVDQYFFPALKWISAVNDLRIAPWELLRKPEEALHFVIQISDSRHGDPIRDLNPAMTEFLAPDAKSYTTFIETFDGEALVVHIFWDRVGLMQGAHPTIKERPDAYSHLLSILSYEVLGKVLNADEFIYYTNPLAFYSSDQNWKSHVLRELSAHRAAERSLNNLLKFGGSKLSPQMESELRTQKMMIEYKLERWQDTAHHQFKGSVVVDFESEKEKRRRCQASIISTEGF